MKKSILLALLALGLTVGYVGAASAQNASNGHDVSPGHYVAGSDEEDTDFAPLMTIMAAAMNQPLTTRASMRANCALVTM